MKNTNFFLAMTFAVAYAVVLSLGLECLLILLGSSFGVSLDSATAIERYPRFFAFCITVVILALVALAMIFISSLKVSDKLGFSKKLWWVQMIGAFVISVPMIKPWEMLFDFLQRAF